VQAINTNYDFVFNFNLLPGGFNPGDTLQYFVAAQDGASTANVGTLGASVSPCPTSVVFTSSQTVSGAPNISFFVYRKLYSGAISVGTGSGQTFATLTGTTGLFNAINNGWVSGNIVATVSSDLAETGAIGLNQWTEFNSGTCASITPPGFILTIQSDGNLRQIQNSGNLTTSMIRLNGADRVKFLGGTGTTRNLRFINTNTSASSCASVFYFDNASFRDTVQNCDVQTNSTLSFSSTNAGRGAICLNPASTSSDSVYIIGNTIHESSGVITLPNYGIIVESCTPGNYIQVINNEIYNFDRYGFATASSGSLTLLDTCVFSGNSFYKSSAIAHTGAYDGIYINTTTSYGRFYINGNYIGGTSASGKIGKYSMDLYAHSGV
jgi:hypothetical protein